ncbi:MAG: hypothetical protein IJ933_06360, partial [Bacteroidales bacterium]|nr:hypothetical protein [Bacteroidales bacterium]
KMHVFLVEDSYYLYHNGVFPQVKKALLNIADCLDNTDNANILYFIPQTIHVRYISAEQTHNLNMLCEMADYHLQPQCDSTATGNNLPEAITEAMDYCIAHRKNYETIILTLISRGLNTGPSRRFAEDLAQRA